MPIIENNMPSNSKKRSLTGQPVLDMPNPRSACFSTELTAIRSSLFRPEIWNTTQASWCLFQRDNLITDESVVEEIVWRPMAFSAEQAAMTEDAVARRATLEEPPLTLQQRHGIELVARLIRPEDQEVCSSFACGSEPYLLAVARYLQRTYWERPERRGRTIVAFDSEEDTLLFGFGVWTHKDSPFPEGVRRVIRVPWFGVDERYWGATDSAGRSCAAVLYATVEDDAQAHPDSGPEMPIELFCDEANERGLAFWASRGFTKIGVADGAPHLHRLIRQAPWGSKVLHRGTDPARSTRRLKVVDRGFLIWLGHQDRSELLADAGLPDPRDSQPTLLQQALEEGEGGRP